MLPLEQFDALGDAHLGHLLGVEGGEFAAGLVQGVELLLLEDGGGRVVAQGDEEGRRRTRVGAG